MNPMCNEVAAEKQGGTNEYEIAFISFDIMKDMGP